MEILQQIRHAISWSCFGCSAFVLLGYGAKLIPAIAVGILAILVLVNLLGLFLFFNYPEYREEVAFGLVAEIVAGVLLCL